MLKNFLLSLTTSLENKIKQINTDNLNSQKKFFKKDFYQVEDVCNCDVFISNSEIKNFLVQVTTISIYPKITVVSHTNKTAKIAIGTVITSENPNELSKKSSIVCGGKTFPNNNLSPNNSWKNFPNEGFWIPEIFFKIENIHQSPTLSKIKIIITSTNLNGLKNLLNKIREVITNQKPASQLRNNQEYLELFSSKEKTFNPDFNCYSKAFSKVQNFIKDHHDNCDKKVVLARETSFQLPSQFNFLENILNKFFSNFNNGYFYIFQASKLNAYIGITPEILFRRDKNNIETEALAGTLNTISKENSVDTLEQQLLDDEKNTTENNVVSKYITKKLLNICTEIQTTNIETLLAGKLIHLRKKIFAKLNNQVSDPDFEILKLLHPTPSMAGTPLVDALKIIFDSENFNRCWYASPIGFVEKDQSEFIILIRGILLTDNSAKIYTGSGIITKSKLLDEWEELNNKTNAILANLLSG